MCVSAPFPIVCVHSAGRLDKATRISVSSAACQTERNTIRGVTLNVVCGVSQSTLISSRSRQLSFYYLNFKLFIVIIRNPCSKLRAIRPTINRYALTSSFQLFPVNCLPFLTFCSFVCARARACVFSDRKFEASVNFYCSLSCYPWSVINPLTL